LKDDAEEAQERSGGGGVGRLDAIAALGFTGVALSSRGWGATATSSGGRGGRKGCKSDGRNSGELELHVER